jgi:hypothetical protein
MKTKYLLPSRYKRMGWFVFVPSVVLGLISYFCEWEPALLDVRVWGFTGLEDTMGKLDIIQAPINNILNEICGVLIILSGLMVAFSKEREEDELISMVRLESLVWATYWNYAILILAFVLVYDMAFFAVMVFNMFTILVLFIIKFNWALHKLQKSLVHEE